MVAYHAGLPVPGGFVGVDVFFVISGYVITRMLRREWEATGRIDFAAFYLRRFKRLMPALALVVAFTVVVSGLVLSPLGPQQTALETGLGSLGLVANWVVSTTTGGYFDPPAEANPFLHTWSLSVEEQFYLVFPALLAFCWIGVRRGRRSDLAVAIVLAVTGVSLVAALVGVNPFVHSWLFGFYSPLTRAWEFGVGALLALVTVKGRRAAGFAGVALLAVSLWTIDHTTRFPGMWTLLPVGAAALLIVAGSGETNVVTRLLSSRPLVKIGDWSYSIYLWHWPLIVFASTLWPSSPHARLFAAALSLAPAVCSYVFVEQPIRSLRLGSRMRVAILVAAVLATPLAADTPLAATVPGVWSPSYSSSELVASHSGAIGQDFLYRYMRTHYVPCTPVALRAASPVWDGVVRCWQSRPGPLDLAVIGDSHAEHLFVGLANQDPRLNVGYYITPWYIEPTMEQPTFARIVHTVAATPQTRTVIVNALWGARVAAEQNLRATLAALAAAHKHVFVTDDVPPFPFDAFACKYRRALFMHSECEMPRADFDTTYFRGLDAAVRDVPGAHLIKTAGAFCDVRHCSMVHDGKLLYRDDNHLNIAGSQYVARLIRADRVFKAALSGS